MTLQKLLSSLLFTCLLSSCAGSAPGSSPQPSAAPDNQESTEQAKIENIEIKMNQVFHSTDIQVDYSELEKRGFAFGDSLTLTFSNGTVIDDLPYYNGYYAKIGNPVAVYYPGLYGLNFALNLGRSTWETYGFQEGDSVTIELREKGKYKNEQETFAQTHSDDLEDYPSPERFANFRALAGGSLLPDFVYRSATMTSSSMNRAAVVDDLAEKYGVKAVLDFSDTQEDLQKYRGESTWSSDYFDKLEESGKVKLVGLGGESRLRGIP